MTQSSGEIIALASVFTALAIAAVTLRLWARRTTKQPLMADDYLACASLTTMIGLLTVPLIILCADANFGNHIARLPNGEPVPPSHLFNVCQLVLEVCGYVPIALAKASVLFFYKRVFRGPVLTIVVYTLLSLVVAWCITFFFGTLFECTPIHKSLILPPGDPQVHCIDEIKLFYAGASTDVIIDFAILLVPGPLVAKLQMPTARKIGLILVFLTGALAIAASITRLVEFVYAGRKQLAGDTDVTYYVAPTVYWTMIEAALAIIAVCLPSLRPVFRNLSPEQVLSSLRSVFSLHSRDSRQGTADWAGRKTAESAGTDNRQGGSEASLIDRLRFGASNARGSVHNGYTSAVGSGPVRENGALDIPMNGILIETTFESRKETMMI